MDEDQASELEALDGLLSNPSAEPIKLSFGLLKFITENFSNEIGRGGFGVVYKGTLQNGEVAVKKISNVYDQLSDKLFMDEITCLMKAKHKNIVRFLGYCSENQGEMVRYNGNYVMAEELKRLLCFEYVPNGNIRDYLEEKLDESDEWHIRYRIIKGICEGLHYLHAERISHLDLKPENVMLDACMEAKITDFGLARCLVEGQSKVYTNTIRGTPGYIAPEYINTGEISLKSDIYALGIIIIKLITRRNIIDFDNWHELSDVDNLQVKCCIEIARACIEVDQDKRPTVVEIIRELDGKENIIQVWTDVASSSTDQWHELSDVDNLQVKCCIEIARACIEVDQDKRPTVVEIIRELDGKENIIQVWTDVASSSTDQILETRNHAEEKKRVYLPYNVLPLNTGSPNQASVRHPEIQSSFRVLQNARGLPWPKHHQRNADADLLEWLQAMFGFQKDNVSDQREYLVLLLANVHTSKPEQEPMLDANALDNVMNKFFENYKRWCKYLGRKSSLLMPTIQQEVQQRKLLYMGLYLLIWGEAVTLRFIPECLFYIYHHMAFELYGMLAGNVSSVTGENVKPAYGGEEEAFRKKVVAPINKILEEVLTPHIKILQEAEGSKTNKSKHSHWRNYEDLNAYFGSRDCFRLGWPMRPNADFFEAPDLAPAPRDQMKRVIHACTRWLRTWSVPKRS